MVCGGPITEARQRQTDELGTDRVAEHHRQYEIFQSQPEGATEVGFFVQTQEIARNEDARLGSLIAGGVKDLIADGDLPRRGLLGECDGALVRKCSVARIELRVIVAESPEFRSRLAMPHVRALLTSAFVRLHETSKFTIFTWPI
jgi:hypothetical protein